MSSRVYNSERATYSINSPARFFLSGPSSCGKTTWCAELVKNADTMIKPPPQQIIWCYSIWQRLYDELLQTHPNIQFHEGMVDFENLRESSETSKLLILDDMMNVISEKNLSDTFCKISHHCNCTVVFMSQNLFHKGSRDARMNSEYVILFKSPADKLSISNFARQVYPKKVLHFLEAFADATKKPYGYLFCDLSQQTKDTQRLRTNIFPAESSSTPSLNNREIVYTKKN